jgi:uncharacterized protein YdhG (YjbR/CyaY superfamily)
MRLLSTFSPTNYTHRVTTFNSLINTFTGNQKSALQETVKAIEELFPLATKDVAWSMPTFKVGDDYLCHIMGFKNHNSLFPSSGSLTDQFTKELSRYTVSKGTLQFSQDQALPKPLLKKLLLARIEQINASYPKKNGAFVEYYKNGGIKASGKYKGDQPHGAWKFYRLDGSLMRSGNFNQGTQSGVWTTYDKNGKKIKETTF